MWNGSRVAVVVPAYREAALIGRTLSSIPAFVDAIYVVDDASDDGTLKAARRAGDTRVRCLEHAVNRGVGAAIVSGYRAALDERADVLAVMAGDNQMHPDDLASVIRPVADGSADYVKGNRFVHPEAHRMPLARRLAGEVLSLATRLATGLPVHDCQCGYTALSAACARALPLDELWPRFGYPNDLLGMLAARGLKVAEVPVRPVYAGEASGIRVWHGPLVLGLIARRAWLERELRTAQARNARSTMRSAQRSA
jgi:glycosyltransferase involved in cell wall biosynthesis